MIAADSRTPTTWVALVQVVGVVAFVLFLSTDGGDATDTTVEWWSALVGGLLVPAYLGGLYALGRWAGRAGEPTTGSVRFVTRTICRVVLGLFVLSLVLASAWLLGELVFAPMG